MPLCASLPSLFAITESKDAWVMDYWSDLADDEGWNHLFTRPSNDWEVEEVQRLLFQLGSKVVVEGMDDMLFWT